MTLIRVPSSIGVFFAQKANQFLVPAGAVDPSCCVSGGLPGGPGAKRFVGSLEAGPTPLLVTIGSTRKWANGPKSDGQQPDHGVKGSSTKPKTTWATSTSKARLMLEFLKVFDFCLENGDGFHDQCHKWQSLGFEEQSLPPGEAFDYVRSILVDGDSQSYLTTCFLQS